jgi:hypothetical protein
MLPFPDESVDTVYSSHMLEHVPISERPYATGIGSSDPAGLSRAWSRTSSFMKKDTVYPLMECRSQAVLYAGVIAKRV